MVIKGAWLLPLSWLLLLFGVLLMVMSIAPAFAQGDVKFADPDWVAKMMDNSPDRVVAVLLKHITQSQADSIEAELFPKPTAEAQKQALEVARTTLLRAGFEKTDKLVTDIQDKSAAVAMEATGADTPSP